MMMGETTSILTPVRRFLRELRPCAVPRSMRQFAEEEIILPDGPRKGMRFRVSYMPFLGFVLDAFDGEQFTDFYMTGPVQGGKTFITLVIPAAYHLFERQEGIILAAPDLDLAQAIWRERILPALERTRYKKLLPVIGSGSKGGKAKSVRLRNGALVRFMGAGGSDAQRSSHTARVILATELDKMDTAGDVSREANPVKQFQGRSAAFGDQARFYGECTISTAAGLIAQQVTEVGSNSSIYLRCEHCGGWSAPERDRFIGWETAESVIEAREKGRYVCGACGVMWSEADRQAALCSPMLVHGGQEVAPDGTITGPQPKTPVFGLRWNAMHSPMVPMAKIAAEEWESKRFEREDDEKALHQFVWVIPWEDRLQGKQLSYEMLAGHTGDYYANPLGRGDELPADVDFGIGSVDVQKAVLYWQIDGYSRDGLTRFTLDYGVEEIVQEGSDRDPTEGDLRRALDAVREHQMGTYKCLNMWVDCGYRHEGALEHVVRIWCHEQGQQVNALVGRSEGQFRSQSRRVSGKTLKLLPDVPGEMIQCRLQDDHSRLWFLDVDRLKDEVHHRLFRERGSVGYHWFPRDAANKSRTGRSRGPGSMGWILSHYMRVKREIQMVKGRERRIWVEHGAQHLWDCGCYSLAGAFVTVAELTALDADKAARQPKKPGEAKSKDIRVEY